LKELQRRQEEDERRRQPHKGPSPSRIAGERIETTFPAEGGIRTETTLGEERARLGVSEQPSSWRMSLSRSARFEPYDLRGTETGDGFEGILIRKHTYESLDRKASNRSWEKAYSVIRGGQLAFFKDQRHREESALLHNEQPISLPGCSVHVASEYTKKRNVLSLRLTQGAEYLLQASSEDDMNRWLHYLQVATGQSTAYEPGRSQTMPEGGGKAKKGFFSLKKK
jgi:hypothetical protein